MAAVRATSTTICVWRHIVKISFMVLPAVGRLQIRGFSRRVLCRWAAPRRPPGRIISSRPKKRHPFPKPRTCGPKPEACPSPRYTFEATVTGESQEKRDGQQRREHDKDQGVAAGHLKGQKKGARGARPKPPGLQGHRKDVGRTDGRDEDRNQERDALADALQDAALVQIQTA